LYSIKLFLLQPGLTGIRKSFSLLTGNNNAITEPILTSSKESIMRQVLKNHRAILLCIAMGLLVYALNSGFGGLFATATAQTKEFTSAKAKDEAKAAPQTAAAPKIIPPPTDANELSMEVAALRTLYLLKAGPDQNEEYNSYDGIRNFLKDKDIAQPHARGLPRSARIT
jgi:hypothetical protein